ncbi:hypothetical protein Tco_1265165 [Tanacetum coccineum]
MLQKEMPTTEATASRVCPQCSVPSVQMDMRLNGEYAPYRKTLKVPEIMGSCLKLLCLKLCKVMAPLKPPISGKGLQTSTYPREALFSITLPILGLILFALLIDNMQTYLQSLTIRLEKKRFKRRDVSDVTSITSG